LNLFVLINLQTEHQMKSTFLTLGLIAFLGISAFSPNSKTKIDPDHTNYYKATSVDLGPIKVDIQDAVSRIDFTKFKIKFSNTTNNFILYRPQESTFNIANQTYPTQDKKSILIQPLDNSTRVLDIKANPGDNLHVDEYTFNLDGLYKVIPTEVLVVAPDFLLPPSVNQFIAGDFTVEMVNMTKKTQETSVKFKVTYTGEGMGIIDSKNIAVKIENGQQFANEKREKPILLEKGESDTFTALFHIEGKIADMQFANMNIVWNQTFKNSKLVKINGTALKLILDSGLTFGKNK